MSFHYASVNYTKLNLAERIQYYHRFLFSFLVASLARQYKADKYCSILFIYVQYTVRFKNIYHQ